MAPRCYSPASSTHAPMELQLERIGDTTDNCTTRALERDDSALYGSAMTKLVVLALALTVAACSDPGDCGEAQVRVEYVSGSRDGQFVCKPRPTTCDDADPCVDQDCIAEMYKLCDSPYVAVGCADLFAPPIISCNP